MERPDSFTLKNGTKSKLPFSNKEYQKRLDKVILLSNDNWTSGISITDDFSCIWKQPRIVEKTQLGLLGPLNNS